MKVVNPIVEVESTSLSEERSCRVGRRVDERVEYRVGFVDEALQFNGVYATDWSDEVSDVVGGVGATVGREIINDPRGLPVITGDNSNSCCAIEARDIGF